MIATTEEALPLDTEPPLPFTRTLHKFAVRLCLLLPFYIACVLVPFRFGHLLCLGLAPLVPPQLQWLEGSVLLSQFPMPYDLFRYRLTVKAVVQWYVDTAEHLLGLHWTVPPAGVK